jgi:hypothetical protein
MSTLVMAFVKYIIVMITVVTVFDTGHAQDTTGTVPGHGRRFIDLDGDGYNDNAPDHDGDGIPNGLDPDWQRRKGGRGKGRRFQYLNLEGTMAEDTVGTFSGQASADTTADTSMADSLTHPLPAQWKKQQQRKK